MNFSNGIETTMNTSIKGIFLLILTAASNFNSETLGCQTQTLLNNNMLAKHLLNLALIYFAINLTSDSKLDHPNTILKRTIYVWLGYIFFIRMPLKVTIMVFMLLLSTYILGNYIDYYKKKDEENEKNVGATPMHSGLVATFSNVRRILFNVTPVIIAIGVIIYVIQKRKEYGKKFDLYKFIFGKNVCDSMK